MNTRNFAMATAASVVAVVALILSVPAIASSMSTPQNNAFQQIPQRLRNVPTQAAQLSVGRSITLTSIAGGFRQANDKSVNGTASGSLSFSVTRVYARGYSLTVTGGSIAFNGATYSVSGGTAELGPYGSRLVGQGDAVTAQFLFGGRSLGRFGGTGYGVLGIDLKSGLDEYIVRLLVTVTV
jgi:hypothetical protein